MNDNTFSAADNLIALVFSGRARVISRHIEFRTPTGRKFKYELSGHPVSRHTTLAGAQVLARQIFREKYRYCEWDRKHPHVDVETEITEKIVESILRIAEAMRKKEAHERENAPKSRVFAYWAIFS